MKEIVASQLPGKVEEIKNFRKAHGGDSVSTKKYCKKYQHDDPSDRSVPKSWNVYIILESSKFTRNDTFIFKLNPIYQNFLCLTLIRESWKKDPKRGTITERVLRKKNPERSIASFCICSHVLEFFSGKRASRYMRARHISPHIGICHFKLLS